MGQFIFHYWLKWRHRFFYTQDSSSTVTEAPFLTSLPRSILMDYAYGNCYNQYASLVGSTPHFHVWLPYNMTEDQKSNLSAFLVPSFVPVYKPYGDTLHQRLWYSLSATDFTLQLWNLLWYNKKEILHLSQIGY